MKQKTEAKSQALNDSGGSDPSLEPPAKVAPRLPPEAVPVRIMTLSKPNPISGVRQVAVGKEPFSDGQGGVHGTVTAMHLVAGIVYLTIAGKIAYAVREWESVAF